MRNKIDFSVIAFREAKLPWDESLEAAGRTNIWTTCAAISYTRTKTLAELYTATWTGPVKAARMNESAFVEKRELTTPPREYFP